MKQKILLIIVLVLLTSISTYAELLTPEKLWSLKRISGASLSPDGSELLFSISTPNFEKNNSKSDLYIVNIKSKDMKRLTFEGNHNSSPCWSAKGDKIGFISDRSGTAQAYIMDLKGGDPKQLTFLKNGVSFLSWSPNGKYLAFTSDVNIDLRIDEIYKDLTKVNAMVFDDLPIRHWDEWKDEKYRHIFVIPSEGGEPKDLMPGERYDTPLKPFGGATDIVWSPTGYDIAYTCKKVDNPESSTNSDIYLVSVLGGKAVNISSGDPRFPLLGASMSPKFSPDGKHIVFHSQKRAGFESDRIRLIDY